MERSLFPTLVRLMMLKEYRKLYIPLIKDHVLNQKRSYMFYSQFQDHCKENMDDPDIIDMAKFFFSKYNFSSGLLLVGICKSDPEFVKEVVKLPNLIIFEVHPFMIYLDNNYSEISELAKEFFDRYLKKQPKGHANYLVTYQTEVRQIVKATSNGLSAALIEYCFSSLGSLKPEDGKEIHINDRTHYYECLRTLLVSEDITVRTRLKEKLKDNKHGLLLLAENEKNAQPLTKKINDPSKCIVQ